MNPSKNKQHIWYRAIGGVFQVTDAAGVTRTGKCIAASEGGELTLANEDGTFTVQVGFVTATRIASRTAPVAIVHRERNTQHWDGWHVTEHHWQATDGAGDFVLPAVASQNLARV